MNGKYWGTSVFRPADTDGYTPFAGYINDKATAERVVAACKK